MRYALLLCTALLCATAAQAQVFDVKLGPAKLGTLKLAQRGGTITLKTTLSSTPMNVFNGNFTADTKRAGGGHSFHSISRSSRKNREIKLRFDGARAVETLVEPSTEMTSLSDPTRVPAGVIDPVRAVAALLSAPDCPGKMALYDGRRAITLSPTGKTADGDTQTCAMSYKVVAGPGHLSPLKISKAKMQLVYVTTNGSRALARINLSSGPFKLTLNRTR
jgi:hypothetical protein